MSRDLSNRPHELLNVRIGNIVEGIGINGEKYAKVTIGAGGKTTQRKVAQKIVKNIKMFLEREKSLS
jgi:hypothetical protein